MKRATAMLVLMSALLGSACAPNPSCEDWRTAMDDMYARCDLPFRAAFFYPDGTEATCGDVHEIPDSHLIECECIPWTKTADCDALAANPNDVHPTCQPEFSYYPPGGM